MSRFFAAHAALAAKKAKQADFAVSRFKKTGNATVKNITAASLVTFAVLTLQIKERRVSGRGRQAHPKCLPTPTTETSSASMGCTAGSLKSQRQSRRGWETWGMATGMRSTWVRNFRNGRLVHAAGAGRSWP